MFQPQLLNHSPKHPVSFLPLAPLACDPESLSLASCSGGKVTALLDAAAHLGPLPAASYQLLVCTRPTYARVPGHTGAQDPGGSAKTGRPTSWPPGPVQFGGSPGHRDQARNDLMLAGAPSQRHASAAPGSNSRRAERLISSDTGLTDTSLSLRFMCAVKTLT